MPQYVVDTSTVPPEDWKYTVEATGRTLSSKNYSLVFDQVRQYCESNSIPVPSHQEIVNQMCERLTIHCAEGTESLVNRFILGLPARPASSCCTDLSKYPVKKEAL